MDVQTELLSKGVICEEEREEIESQNTTTRKLHRFYTALGKKSPELVKIAIQILHKTNQEKAADKLSEYHEWSNNKGNTENRDDELDQKNGNKLIEKQTPQLNHPSSSANSFANSEAVEPNIHQNKKVEEGHSGNPPATDPPQKFKPAITRQPKSREIKRSKTMTKTSLGEDQVRTRYRENPDEKTRLVVQDENRDVCCECMKKCFNQICPGIDQFNCCPINLSCC